MTEHYVFSLIRMTATTSCCRVIQFAFYVPYRTARIPLTRSQIKLSLGLESVLLTELRSVYKFPGFAGKLALEVSFVRNTNWEGVSQNEENPNYGNPNYGKTSSFS